MFSLSEQAEEMNIPSWAVSALTRLAERGIDVTSLERPASSDVEEDLRLVLRASDQERSYFVGLASKVTSSLLSQLQRLQAGHVLVVTRRMPSGLAQTSRTLGVHFVDAAGNMFLDWGNVLIDVEGRKPAEGDLETPSPSHRAFGRQGLTVVFALLCGNRTTGSLREIASFSQASLGTVQIVMKELAGLGFVEQGRGQSTLHRTKDLLTRWSETYPNTLGPSLAFGEYWVDDPASLLDSKVTPARFDALWGGESAFAQRYRHLRPSTLTVYSAERPVKLLATWRARKPHDAPANVFVRRRFWASPASIDAITPAPLIYADLLATREARQLEAAARLRETDDHLKYLDSH